MAPVQWIWVFSASRRRRSFPPPGLRNRNARDGKKKLSIDNSSWVASVSSKSNWWVNSNVSVEAMLESRPYWIHKSKKSRVCKARVSCSLLKGENFDVNSDNSFEKSFSWEIWSLAKNCWIAFVSWFVYRWAKAAVLLWLRVVLEQIGKQTCLWMLLWIS